MTELASRTRGPGFFPPPYPYDRLDDLRSAATLTTAGSSTSQ